MKEALLQMTGITKRFPGVKALDGVSLTVQGGSVHALMGENGAGKSTLMKCLFGIYSPDSGTVRLKGRPVVFRNPREALEQGVAMVHQELNQALSRNVMDNLWLGRYPKTGGMFVSETAMRQQTEALFERLSITVDPRAILGTLPVAQRQMVEIAKAVSYRAKILVLDEPTSSLTQRETENLFRLVRSLRNQGCGIIYISHKMEEILALCDEITVMRDGALVATRPAEGMTTEEIIRLMVGRTLTQRFPEKHHCPGAPLLQVKGLSAIYAPVRDVSFVLREGEVLGIAGLAGAGRTELLETLFGLRARARGDIQLRGRNLDCRCARKAIRSGIALVTEERRKTGIFGNLSLVENTVISSLTRHRRGGVWLSGTSMKRDTDWVMGAMRVKAPSREIAIRTLSGGNQQKVIFGRWLLTEPSVLLLDEPTRGIDVGAKFDIYRLILEQAEKGRGIILVSSELPELLGVCDRILVMSGGRLAGEVAAAHTTQEEIMTLAARFV